MNGNSSRWLIERRYGFGVGGVTLAATSRAKAPRQAPAAPGASAGVLAGFLLFSAGVISLSRQSPEQASDLEVAWLAPGKDSPEEAKRQSEAEAPAIPTGDPAPRIAELPERPAAQRNEPVSSSQPARVPPLVELAELKPAELAEVKLPQDPPPARITASEKRVPRNLGSFPGRELRRPAEAPPAVPRVSRKVASAELAPAVPSDIALPPAQAAGRPPTELAAASPPRSSPGRTARSVGRPAGNPRHQLASVSLPNAPGSHAAGSPGPIPSPRRGRPNPGAAERRAPKVAISAPTRASSHSRVPEALSAATVRSGRDRPRAGRRGDDSRFEAVSLASLASCRSDRDEDRLKMAVLAARSRQVTCRSDAGAFYFVEARNLNAFLLSIERAPDRPLEDRCGELAHALRCLEQATNEGTVQ